jgi:hypothetical protein
VMLDYQVVVLVSMLEKFAPLCNQQVFSSDTLTRLIDMLQLSNERCTEGSWKYFTTRLLLEILERCASTGTNTEYEQEQQRELYKTFFCHFCKRARILRVDRNYESLEDFVRVHLDLMS